MEIPWSDVANTVFVALVGGSLVWLVVSREIAIKKDRAELRRLRMTPEQRREELRKRAANTPHLDKMLAMNPDGEDAQAHKFMQKDDEGKVIQDFMDYRDKKE